MKLRRVIYFLDLIKFVILSCIAYKNGMLLNFTLIYIDIGVDNYNFFDIFCLAMKTSGGPATGKLFIVRVFLCFFFFMLCFD
jgi:hypothetical protein